MLKWLSSAATLGLLFGAAHSAAAQCPHENDPNLCNPNQRQVNITGATLFRAFFEANASTNDFIDVDGDGCFGFGDPNCLPNNVDQLAPPANFNDWWIVQHRSVGSLRGFEEFVTYQACCDLPDILPTERSTINHQLYFDGSNIVWPGAVCATDVDGDGTLDETGTPVCHCTMDLGIVDVVSSWAVAVPGTPAWDRTPTQPGYGVGGFSSVPLDPNCTDGDSFNYGLESISRDCDGDGTPDTLLNFNVGAPDDNTVFDTTIAYVTIVPIANRGVFGGAWDPNDRFAGPAITYSDMQYHWVTGRRKSGENLAAATRDDESGTRNGWMNSIGIDPSQGRGDNRGGRTTSSTRTNLGPCHRVTNCGSSSHIENAVQQRRLALGFTGLSGNTSAAADAAAGLYEIINVIKDIPPYNATQPVRPTVSTALDNCDPNTGFTIGGAQTFTSRGSPFEIDPNSPAFMENQNAADYLRNIVASIISFTDPGGVTDPDNNLMPGQYLAQTFFLFGALDCEQDLLTPLQFNPTDPNQFNQPLQDYIRANSNLGVSTLPADGHATPDYGSRNSAGLVPVRTQGVYTYWVGANSFTIGGGARLAQANRLHGDFNKDGVRDANDIPAMIACLASPSTFDTTDNGGDPGDMAADVIIPDVMGDMDGNGVFDAADIRYFADGLALDSNGNLNRELGFTLVDTAHGGNFFGTTIADNPAEGSNVYANGASRFDVIGSGIVAPGDAPIGANGVVDNADLCYIFENFGDWSNLDVAQNIDLSADMNGDLVIDIADVNAFLSGAWGCTCFGDLNCDGDVGFQDLVRLLASFGVAGGYAEGDLNCDGTVGFQDLVSLLSAYGQSCP